jgi:hypothetical protein
MVSSPAKFVPMGPLLFLLHDLPNLMEQSSSLKLIVAQLLKKFTIRALPCSKEPVLFLRQRNPVHIITNYSFKIHINIILQSTARSSKRFLSFRI